jgi:hypothetical protein
VPHLPGERVFVHLFVSAASLLPRMAKELAGMKACRACGVVKRADGRITGCRGYARIVPRYLIKQERADGSVQLGR